VDPETEAVRTALAAVLGPAERVDRVVPAVGCALVLTDLRLILVRAGAAYRPRTGIRDWPLDREIRIRMTPGQDRLIIERGNVSASVFLIRQHVDATIDLVMEVRRRSYGEPDRLDDIEGRMTSPPPDGRP
jgi:hypothetical protein